MQDKEQMRQKFEACMHRGDTYTERDFQMWCAGYAQGFFEGVLDGGTWVNQPFAIVVDRLYDGSGMEVAVFDGVESYVFADGDCYQRESENMLSSGHAAEFLTHHQFQERFIRAALEKSHD